jgi:hypothetical protein
MIRSFFYGKRRTRVEAVRSAARSLLVGLVAAWACAAPAHHSFGAIYDSGRHVTLKGVVRQFQFIHPHPFLVFDVALEKGGSQSWRAEMDNRFELADIGITEQTFQPGDQVVVRGNPGRTEANILYMWQLERPADGLHYEQVGSTPRIRRP